MLPRNKLGFVLSLFVALAASAAGCRPIRLVFPNQPAAIAVSPSPSVTATLPPSPTHTRTATPVPPTSTPTASPTPSPSPTLDIAQAEILAELLEVVNESYLYKDFNGVDWPSIYEDVEDRISVGLTREEFYLAMDELVYSLGDDHSFYLDPMEVSRQQAEFEGRQGFVGIGAILVGLPEHNRAVILLTFEGSPAEEAGLRHRDSILAADGQPIVDEQGRIRDIIRGPEGSLVTLLVESPGEPPRSVQLERRWIDGPFDVPHWLLRTPADLRIGYILLPNFRDSTIPEQVTQAIRSLSETAPLDGIIVDNRWNPGGVNTVFRGTIRHFTGGTLGYFINRTSQRILRVTPLDIEGSQRVPLVVLVGQDTFSFGEIFSGILSDQGRAFLIGETTEGNVETLRAFDFVDGSRAWIAHEAFRPYFDNTEDWELSGIIPDLAVAADWHAYPLEEDPVILAALQYLDAR